MKHVTRLEANIHQNSPSCKVFEYGSNATIDGADIEIDGQYPEGNFALNEKSDFVVRVLAGTGKLVTKNKETLLNVGDAAFVEHGESYYFEGKDLQLFMACSPAWNPEQYRVSE